jgi:hypothetical protein
MRSDRPRRHRKQSDQLAPDATWGTIVVVLALAGLAFIVFIPLREGASGSGKFYLAALDLLFLSYGIRHIVRARGREKRRGSPEDLTNR